MLLRSSEQHAAVAMRCTVVSRQHAAANDAHQKDNGLQSVSPSSHAMLDQGTLHTDAQRRPTWTKHAPCSRINQPAHIFTLHGGCHLSRRAPTAKQAC